LDLSEISDVTNVHQVKRDDILVYTCVNDINICLNWYHKNDISLKFDFLIYISYFFAIFCIHLSN